MGKSVVIVESHAKAKTINKILGPGYVVKACLGHIRDLPKDEFGIDVEKDFEPEYRIIPGRLKILKDLKASIKKADAVYLAPDPDREGEAIAWHLLQALQIGGGADEKRGASAKAGGRRKAARPAGIPVYRVTFNEITKKAVLDAFTKPSEISMAKVHAQQARRLLDRIVGYKLSPLLWKKIGKGLSAGRVQSVAVRLVVEREKEIRAFKPEEYWTVAVKLATPEETTFVAELRKRNGEDLGIPDEAAARAIVEDLRRCRFELTGVASREKTETPPPPFSTSLMQQQASIKLGFSTKKTMLIAQQLYEGIELGEEGSVGLITYMRTDSFRIADEAIAECRSFIPAQFGDRYLEASARAFPSRGKAQEAHEAIRPTSVARAPDRLKPFLTEDQFKLYRLIWRRFLATQMSVARYKVTDASLTAAPPDGTVRYDLQAKGRELLFDGFTRVAGHKLKKDEQLLPPLREGVDLKPAEVVPTQHFTQPPPRYSEASLVKALEKFGIGRPSTYAPIISTIQERGYVRQELRKLYATELGSLVTEKLVAHFEDIMNTGYTSQMEEQLDRIEEEKSPWVDVLKTFHGDFEKDLRKAQEEMESAKGAAPDSKEACGKCGSPMVIRWNKSGKFLGCSAFPKCKSTKSLESPEATGETCEKCSSPMVVKAGRFGRFLACSAYPNCRNTRPLYMRGRKASIPPGFKMDCEKCAKPIVVKYGRRGGFLACSGYPDCKNTKPFPKDWYVKEGGAKPTPEKEEAPEEVEAGAEDEGG